MWQYKESPKAAMADIRKAMGFLGTEGDSTMMDGRQLQQARIGAGLKQTDVIPHLRAVEKQADASLLSKYENGICLPTGPQLQALCALYGVKLPAFSKQPDARKGDRHKKSIRIQARIPVSKALPDAAALHAAIHRAGWKSAAEWMKHCVGELAGKMDGCI